MRDNLAICLQISLPTKHILFNLFCCFSFFSNSFFSFPFRVFFGAFSPPLLLLPLLPLLLWLHHLHPHHLLFHLFRLLLQFLICMLILMMKMRRRLVMLMMDGNYGTNSEPCVNIATGSPQVRRREKKRREGRVGWN